ncbi:hypothetical protein B0H12DRAFT_1067259 [Mycena haematopus]|nr:hypothetical protein B0H12DRAFT_1067259 [Mycena haematopus]
MQILHHTVAQLGNGNGNEWSRCVAQTCLGCHVWRHKSKINIPSIAGWEIEAALNKEEPSEVGETVSRGRQVKAAENQEPQREVGSACQERIHDRIAASPNQEQDQEKTMRKQSNPCVPIGTVDARQKVQPRYQKRYDGAGTPGFRPSQESLKETVWICLRRPWWWKQRRKQRKKTMTSHHTGIRFGAATPFLTQTDRTVEGGVLDAWGNDRTGIMTKFDAPSIEVGSRRRR